jgi:hypothetical protein
MMADAGAPGPVRPSVPTPAGDVDVVLAGARREGDAMSLLTVLLMAALAVGIGWFAWRAVMHG